MRYASCVFAAVTSGGGTCVGGPRKDTPLPVGGCRCKACPALDQDPVSSRETGSFDVCRTGSGLPAVGTERAAAPNTSRPHRSSFAAAKGPTKRGVAFRTDIADLGAALRGEKGITGDSGELNVRSPAVIAQVTYPVGRAGVAPGSRGGSSDPDVLATALVEEFGAAPGSCDAAVAGASFEPKSPCVRGCSRPALPAMPHAVVPSRLYRAVCGVPKPAEAVRVPAVSRSWANEGRFLPAPTRPACSSALPPYASYRTSCGYGFQLSKIHRTMKSTVDLPVSRPQLFICGRESQAPPGCVQPDNAVRLLPARPAGSRRATGACDEGG
ncbi:hypothetical protein YW7DRAFT_05042 [Streptomyces sp. AmelKG-E11A]|nr:hypothetical protein YW7DRAFT_05042 [Streptomyces sp. AmelKG-E11A]